MIRGIQSSNQNNPASVALAAKSLRQQQRNQQHGESKVAGGDIAGAQDTIYLCNFRVSVDGDWLCLKELQDDGSGGTQMPEGGSNTSQINTCGQLSHNKNSNAAAAVHAHNNENNAYSCYESRKDKCVDEKIVERDWVNYYCRFNFLKKQKFRRFLRFVDVINLYFFHVISF